MVRSHHGGGTATVSPTSPSRHSPSQPLQPAANDLLSSCLFPTSPCLAEQIDNRAPDVPFSSPPEASAFAIPSSERKQLQTALSSTDTSSFISSSTRPSLSSSSRKQSSFRRSATLSRFFTGSKNRNQPSQQEPKSKRESPFQKLSFSERLSWVLEQSVQPGRPPHVVLRSATPQRVLRQRAISETSSHSVNPITEENQPGAFSEKTLVWSEADPTDPNSLQLVTAPGQVEVTSPLSLTKDSLEDSQQKAPSPSEPVGYEGQESDYDADYDDEDDDHDAAQQPLGQLVKTEDSNQILNNTDKMDFARALTKRLKRSESRNSRPRISLPVNLISSTNMPYLNGPKLEKITTVEQQSSNAISGDEASPASIRSSTDKSLGSVEPSLTDASSITSEVSPIERNHLTQYFDKSPKRHSHSVIQKPLPQEPQIVSEDFGSAHPLAEFALPSGPPPAIPKRAPSHSKREHARLARVRSIRSSSASFTSRLQSGEYVFSEEPSSSSPSGSIQTSPASQQHPFSNELEQLSEVAEEFGGVTRQIESAEDSHFMRERGLARYGIEDYMTEVSNPWGA